MKRYFFNLRRYTLCFGLISALTLMPLQPAIVIHASQGAIIKLPSIDLGSALADLTQKLQLAFIPSKIVSPFISQSPFLQATAPTITPTGTATSCAYGSDIVVYHKTDSQNPNGGLFGAGIQRNIYGQPSLDSASCIKQIRPSGTKPSWSPDYSLIAYLDADPSAPYNMQVFVTDLSGTHVNQLTHLSGINATSRPSWYVDSTKLIFGTDNGSIYQTDLANNNTTLYEAGSSSSPYYLPTWSPDGNTILYWRFVDLHMMYPNASSLLTGNVPALFAMDYITKTQKFTYLGNTGCGDDPTPLVTPAVTEIN